MVALKQRQGAFADALIAELGARADCMHTVTFDKKASRINPSTSVEGYVHKSAVISAKYLFLFPPGSVGILRFRIVHLWLTAFI